jgi:hypothetical protein
MFAIDSGRPETSSERGEGLEMRSARLLPVIICVGLLLLPSAGCMKPIVARYVYQDHEFGVVAIPINTYLGKASFRDEAEALMDRHFPDGYEIVRAEEVNEGERTLDVGRKTQFETEPNVTALNQMIKLGKLDQTTSFEQKDKIMVRECRIIYKRKSASAGKSLPSGQFTAMTSLNPRFYIDPNEMVRRENAEALAKKLEMIAKNGTTTKKSGDPDVVKVAASAAATGLAQTLTVPTASAIGSLQPTTIIFQPVAVGTLPTPDW